MNKYLREIIWFSIPFILSILIINPFSAGENTLHINIHDTYYVIDKSMFLGIYIILGFLIYLFRILILKYKNTLSNLIFLAFNSAMIYLFTQFILFFDQMSSGWTIYPPLSALKQEEPPEIQENPFEMYLKCFQILLILLLAFSAFKTGQKFNTIKNEN